MGIFSRKKEAQEEHYLSISSLDECIEKSKSEPVYILKHSTICPISASGKNQMDRFLQEHPLTAYLVIVQKDRPLSNEIAVRLSVKHESPQVICLKEGQVASVFNHYEITVDGLKRTLSSE